MRVVCTVYTLERGEHLRLKRRDSGKSQLAQLFHFVLERLSAKLGIKCRPRLVKSLSGYLYLGKSATGQLASGTSIL